MTRGGDQGWFYVRPLAPRVWMIGEPQHVYSYLVEGTERAVLLDTGMGIAPIRPVAEALIRAPLEVINTHYHFDHVGGNHEFDRISIHELGAPLIRAEVPPEILGAYLDYANRQLAAFDDIRRLDNEFTWLLGRESVPVPFPPNFVPGRWRYIPTPATDTLSDGDRIDLGGRALTVIHAPGHSPDGICLLDEHNGLLFTGDSSNAGPLYAHFPDSDLEALITTAHRLVDVAGSVSMVMFCHYGRPLAEPDFFREVVEGLEQVRDGDARLTPAVDIVGTPMLEARFDHFSVSVVDPDAEVPSLVADHG